MEGQLAERQAQKRMDKQLKLQEEQGSLSDMAAELKYKMEVRSHVALLCHANLSC